MTSRSLKLCSLSGPLAFTLFLLGLWPLAHFLPPPSPAASAAEIAGLYAANTLGIRLGAGLVMVSASLFIPLFAAVTVLMKRMEGEDAPLAFTQAISAT